MKWRKHAERVDEYEVVTTVMETGSAFVSDRNLYLEAVFPVNRAVEPHETPLAQMAAYVVKVVQVEGPIHLDEITARIRILWGLGRAGHASERPSSGPSRRRFSTA